CVALLARLPPAGEQSGRPPVRLRAAPPAVQADRQRAHQHQAAVPGRRANLPDRADHARLLLRAERAGPRRGAGRAHHGAGEAAHRRLRAQAGGEVRAGAVGRRRGDLDHRQRAPRGDQPARGGRPRDQRQRRRPGARSLRALAGGLALLAALSAPLARARAESPAVDLDVTLDPDQGRLDGQARLQITNQTGAPLPVVPLWLYPNHLARRAPALTDITYHWLYPGLFSPAEMDVTSVRVAGAPVPVSLADTPAGA